jgi:WD repeat-containing protein 26
MNFDSFASTELDPEAEMHDPSRIPASAVKNGITKDSTNGVASSFATNGAVKNGTPVSDEFFGHSREEVTRLMIQALHDLGYSCLPPFLFSW